MISETKKETLELEKERSKLQTFEEALSCGYSVHKFHPNYLYKDRKFNNHALRISFCNDCLVLDPFGYMVKNEVWKQANGEKKMLLCISCLEIRLGQKIQLEDFTDAHINDGIRFGFSMKI